MRKKASVLVVISLLLCAALFALTPARAADTPAGVSVVRSEGVALRSDNIAEVKKNAVDMALKNAAISALGDLVKKEGLDKGFDISNSDMLSDPFSYILNYRILSEGWITHMDAVPSIAAQIPEAYTYFEQNPGGLELFHIWIEASVDTLRLQDTLARLSVAPNRPTIDITLNIVGVNDYATYKSLVSSLDLVPEIKDVSYSSFYRGRIALRIKSTDDGKTLSPKIAGQIPGNFAVIPGGSRTIIIRAAANN